MSLEIFKMGETDIVEFPKTTESHGPIYMTS